MFWIKCHDYAIIKILFAQIYFVRYIAAAIKYKYTGVTVEFDFLPWLGYVANK